MFLERYRKLLEPEGVSCLPVIDYDKCAGCKRCYRICAFGALDWDNNKPRVFYKMKFGGDKLQSTCTGCRDCVAVCQEGAITIKGNIFISKGAYRSPFPQREVKPPQPLGPDKEYEEIKHKLTEVEQVIYRRRSNRIFKKKPVPRELIARIIESARFAPSAGNCQPVRFIVVDDPAVIDEIRKGIMPVLDMLQKWYINGNFIQRFLLRIYAYFNMGQIDIRPMYAAQWLADSRSPADVFHNAPCLIIVLGDVRGVGKYLLDCGIAAEHIILTAHALGLGTCYVSFIEPLNLLPKLKKKLGISYPYKVVTSIAVGYPKVPQDKEVAREVTPVVWFGDETKTSEYKEEAEDSLNE